MNISVWKIVPVFLAIIIPLSAVGNQRDYSLKDTTLVIAMLDQSKAHRSGQLDSAIYYAEQALQLSQRINYARGEGLSLHYIGGAYFFLGDYEKAEAYENKAVAFSEQHNLPEALAQAYNALALIYQVKVNYPLSIHYFLEALKLEERKPDNYRRIVSVRINLTNIYRLMGDYASAQECARKAWLALKKLPDEQYLRASLATAQGMIFMDRKIYQEAMGYFEQADSLFNSIGNTYDIIIASNNVGVCHLRLDDPRAAAPYLEKTYALAREFKSQEVMVMAMSNLADLRIQQQRVQEGISLSLEALALSKKNQIVQHYAEIYGNLQRAYAVQGDYRTSNRYLQLAYELNDSIKSSEISNAIRKSAESYEVWKKQEELNRVTNEANLKETQLQKEKNFRIFLTILITLLLVIIGFAWYSYRVKSKLSKRLKEQNTKINNQNSVIESVNAELQEKALKLQTNPHFIFNCLNSIQYLIVNDNSKRAVEYHTKFSVYLRKVLEYADMNKISLREEINLLTIYLELESLRLGESFSFTIENTYPDTESPLIPPLLLQPLVENALVHGLSNKPGDKQVTIVFSQDHTRLICTITDNGVGRKASAARKSRPGHHSKGISLTRHRLTLVNKEVNENDIQIIDRVDNTGQALGTTLIISFLTEDE